MARLYNKCSMFLAWEKVFWDCQTAKLWKTSMTIKSKWLSKQTILLGELRMMSRELLTAPRHILKVSCKIFMMSHRLHVKLLINKLIGISVLYFTEHTCWQKARYIESLLCSFPNDQIYRHFEGYCFLTSWVFIGVL